CARVHIGATAVNIDAAQDHGSGTCLIKSTRAADDAVHSVGLRSIDLKCAGSVAKRGKTRCAKSGRDFQSAGIQSKSAGGSAKVGITTDYERAGVDCRSTGVSIRAGKGPCACAVLDERTAGCSDNARDAASAC